MIGLLRAEWLRFRRRRDIWFLILVVAGLTCLAYASGLAGTSVQSGGIQSLPPAALTQQAVERSRFGFPQSLLTVIAQSQVLLLAVVAYLGAATMGAEFSYGTVRTALVVRNDRQGFMAARVVALVTWATALLLLIVLLGSVLPVVASIRGSGFDQTPGISWPGFVALLGSLLLQSGFVLAFVLACTVVFRNAAVSLLLTVASLFFERFLTSLASRAPEPLATLLQLLPFGDLQRLVDRGSQAAHPIVTVVAPNAGVTEPSTLLSLLIGLLWALGLVVSAVALFRRAEIVE